MSVRDWLETFQRSIKAAAEKSQLAKDNSEAAINRSLDSIERSREANYKAHQAIEDLRKQEGTKPPNRS